MHMRGTPATMAGLAHYAAAGAAGSGAPPAPEPADGSAVVEEVVRALGERAAAAQAAGVPRWSLVLDPGLGFAKQPAHSYALLRPAGKLGGPGSPLRGFPLMYGPSRKRFLGTVLPQEAQGGAAAAGAAAAHGRAWATAAAVTAAVAVGADIVRVHDVAEAADVVRVADAVFRGAGVPPIVN
jgi:2-amino-4-hydroxy-6-hydroxymethyldihydropteridine diphosphokinase/dihydropteroate synthase